MHLGKLYSKFDSRCQSYHSRINDINIMRSTISRWQFNYLTEVLISDIWQSWDHFCRELLLSSCRGAKTRDGQIILARLGNNTWQRIGYEAKQASLNRRVTSGGHLNFARWKEPTWGDLDVFIRIVNIIRPSNCLTLLSTYGSFTDLKHLQKVRNACAHKNIGTMLDISLLSTTYSFSTLDYATDLAWKSKSNNAEFAIELWLFEMNLIADYVTTTL